MQPASVGRCVVSLTLTSDPLSHPQPARAQALGAVRRGSRSPCGSQAHLPGTQGCTVTRRPPGRCGGRHTQPESRNENAVRVPVSPENGPRRAAASGLLQLLTDAAPRCPVRSPGCGPEPGCGNLVFERRSLSLDAGLRDVLFCSGVTMHAGRGTREDGGLRRSVQVTPSVRRGLPVA